MTQKISSPLVARINFPGNSPPVRAYVHSAGLELVYDDSADNAYSHLAEVLSKERVLFRQFDYMLALIWGDADDSGKKLRNIDFSGCNVPKTWPGNIDAEPFFYQNGLFVPKKTVGSKGKFCGDCWIVFGREEGYRRTCRDLNDYLHNPPNLREFHPGFFINRAVI